MDKLFILLQHILPQHCLSALMHKLARCKTPWVKTFIINTIIKQFGVNMSEAAEPTRTLMKVSMLFLHVNYVKTHALLNVAVRLSRAPSMAPLAKLVALRMAKYFKLKANHLTCLLYWVMTA